MKQLNPNQEVLIYPNGGWHYHIRGCWMAPTNMPHKEDSYVPITFSKLKTLRTKDGEEYKPDACVTAFIEGKPIQYKPLMRNI